MAGDQFLQARKLHAQNIRESSHWLFQYFMIAVGLSILAAATRAVPYGPLYYFGIPIFLVFFVAPPLFLRGPHHHVRRVFLLIIGLFLLSITGLSFLGLASAGWLILLTTPIIAVALVGRRAAYLTLAASLLISITLGYLHSAGHLQTTIASYGHYVENWRNWMIMSLALMFSGIACIILTEHLRTQWETSNIALYQQHDQMLALVEYAPEAILIYDMDQKSFVTSNSRVERILGYSREELLEEIAPKNLSPPLQPDGQDSSKTASRFMQQALKGEFPVFEWQLKGKSGTLLDCEVSLARLPPFDRRLIRASVVEISARKAEREERAKIQQQLATSQKLEAVGKLTGGVAHDFNNLLAVTLGNLELLRDEINDPDQKKLIDKSIAATLRGSDLTRNMLAFARKASLAPSPIDINQVVRETKNWISRTLPTTITVNTSLLDELWQVEADPSATESALLNLILNAQDAMPKGGKLTIETANMVIDDSYIDLRHEELPPGRYVMLAVSDTGEGIPPEILSEIFEPFYSTKAPGDNSGLGLSMVHGFMRQSNGTVQVYSEQGIGTTFKLFFKAAANPDEPGLKPERETNAPQHDAGRILLAEDDVGVLEVLVKTLTAAGYAVTAATSGDRAKEIYESDPEFDLLITDVVMPGTLLGPGLATELRAQRAGFPVIFMSGYASEATLHGNGLQPDDVRLMKPVQRTDLLNAIWKLLR
mgnify:CR=1 FL=1